MRKVLITDYVHPDLISGLESLGYHVQYDRDFKPGDLLDILPTLSGIVVNTKSRMTAERIAAGQQLEFIARLGSGLDIIDLKAAQERGIKIINTPEGNCDAVAEHAIGMLLCLQNNIIQSDKQVRNQIWTREANRGTELGGKTLGIVGLGNTGRALTRKLSRWGLDMCYFDPYVYTTPAEYDDIRKVSFEELVRNSDIISFHVQLTEETRHMVNDSFFEMCKKDLVLINTSRGAVIETEALVNALAQKRIKGACLDVFENEKPNTYSEQESRMYSRLFEMPNVVLSPHVAGWTHESLKRIAEVMLEKLNS